MIENLFVTYGCDKTFSLYDSAAIDICYANVCTDRQRGRASEGTVAQVPAGESSPARRPYSAVGRRHRSSGYVIPMLIMADMLSATYLFLIS